MTLIERITLLAQAVAGDIKALQDAGGGADPWTYVSLSSALLVNVTANTDSLLRFTPAANKRYEFEAVLFMQSSATTTGIRPGLKFPTAGVQQNVAWALSPTSATAVVQRFWGNTTAANAASTAAVAINEGLFGFVKGALVMGASPAGDMIVTLASEIAGSEVRLMENSFLKYREY